MQLFLIISANFHQWSIGWVICHWKCGWMFTATHGSVAENWPELCTNSEIANTRNICYSICMIGASKSWTSVCVSTRFIQLKIIHLNNNLPGWILQICWLCATSSPFSTNTNANKHQIIWPHFNLVCEFHLKNLSK